MSASGMFARPQREPKRRQQQIDMADNPKMPNPPVKGGAVPYLTVDGAIKAAEFYQKAFAAEVAAIHPPDAKGRTMHALCQWRFDHVQRRLSGTWPSAAGAGRIQHHAPNR
jgi:hypothetical protein